MIIKTLYFHGKGSWSGYYDGSFDIDDNSIKDSRPLKELLIGVKAKLKGFLNIHKIILNFKIKIKGGNKL